MGTDNLFWKRKNKPLKRKSRNRGKPPEAFLIVCEGGKTEPNYFKAFRLSSVSVRVEGLGMNTLSLVRETLKIIKRGPKKRVSVMTRYGAFSIRIISPYKISITPLTSPPGRT